MKAPATPVSAPSTSGAATANLGSCSDPTILFENGLDGRQQPAFIAKNQKDFNHGSALNIGVYVLLLLLRSRSDKADSRTASPGSSRSASRPPATPVRTLSRSLPRPLPPPLPLEARPVRSAPPRPLGRRGRSDFCRSSGTDDRCFRRCCRRVERGVWDYVALCADGGHCLSARRTLQLDCNRPSS